LKAGTMACGNRIEPGLTVLDVKQGKKEAGGSGEKEAGSRSWLKREGPRGEGEKRRTKTRCRIVERRKPPR